MTVSICTLAFGRQAHLVNLVRGLIASDRKPDELVIAVMQRDPYVLPEASFPIRQLMMDNQGIPLAAARNAAARAAKGDRLLFLDVDCIPGPSLIGDYSHAMDRARGVFMGEVGYLPADADTQAMDFKILDSLSVKHSERAGPPTDALGPCNDYRCFWSLNFALAASDFAATGGFDERFTGYGGEDTDFGRMVAAAGMPIWWVRGAKAYHQYHPHHMPPVHHLDSVLANAREFQAKWGEPTMQHWLRAFRLMGLIDRRGDDWVKLREPSDADLALTRQQAHQPYASSANVLSLLEADAFPAAAGAAAPSIASL